MSSAVPQLVIEDFSSALGVQDWNEKEFFIYDGHIPPARWGMPLRQSYYPFLLLESGVIHNTVDLRGNLLRAGDLFLVRPTQIIQVDSISPDATGKILGIDESVLIRENGRLLDSLSFLDAGAPSVLSLTAEEADEVGSRISDILKRVSESNRINKRLVILSMITTFLLEIEGIYRSKSGTLEKTLSRKELINNKFHYLLSEHFIKERTVAFYADRLSITPKHLSSVIKDCTGKTAGELIDSRVILEASVLLRDPHMSIKRVAEELHFSDQFFFSKYFKNFTGLSPSQYRSNI